LSATPKSTLLRTDGIEWKSLASTATAIVAPPPPTADDDASGADAGADAAAQRQVRVTLSTDFSVNISH
jgi:hypothetical protein